MRLEGTSGKAQQAIQNKLAHLERELFYYKTSSRQLKKKLKECLSDTSDPACQALYSQRQTTHNIQIHTSTNEPQVQAVEVPKRTHIATTYTKIDTEQADEKVCSDSHMKRHSQHTTCSSSSSDFPTNEETEVPECNQTHKQSHGGSEKGTAQSEESTEMRPVRLRRRELRQIFPADLQPCDSATGRRRLIVDTSTESMLEDSIEMSTTNQC